MIYNYYCLSIELLLIKIVVLVELVEKWIKREFSNLAAIFSSYKALNPYMALDKY
jgi:hypothetical protein